MIGDGINDAPRLRRLTWASRWACRHGRGARSGARALLRDDWSQVPEAIRVGRRTFRTIQQNITLCALQHCRSDACGVGHPAAGAGGGGTIAAGCGRVSQFVTAFETLSWQVEAIVLPTQSDLSGLIYTRRPCKYCARGSRPRPVAWPRRGTGAQVRRIQRLGLLYCKTVRAEHLANLLRAVLQRPASLG